MIPQTSVKASRNRNLLDLRGIRYYFEKTSYGIKAHRRSSSEIKELIAGAVLVLPDTMRHLLNAIYSACNRYQDMYISQEKFGHLCGIERSQASLLINQLHRLGYFVKRRRFQLPGCKWMSCSYTLPKWALMLTVRVFLSSLIPALGDGIQWNRTLCVNHVSDKSLFSSSSYCTVGTYEEIIARARETLIDKLPTPEPPRASTIQKSEKALQRLSSLQHRLPLVTLHCHESKRPMTFKQIADYLPNADSGATERVAPSPEFKRVAQQADFNLALAQRYLEKAGIDLSMLNGSGAMVINQPPPTPPAPTSAYDEIMRKRARNAIELSRAKYANANQELIAQLEEEKRQIKQQLAELTTKVAP